ncbi:MAG: hypothetical protein AAF631_04240 [Pseudomonadota bacterium]
MFDAYFQFVLRRPVFAAVLILEAGLAWVIYSNVARIDALTGMPILDMEIGYAHDRVNAILGAYGPEAWDRYRLIMVADILHPAVYASLFGALAWSMAENLRWRLLSLTILLAALFDWGENVLIWRMTAAPLPVDADTAAAAGLLSLGKHGFLYGSLAVLVILILRRAWRAIRV